MVSCTLSTNHLINSYGNGWVATDCCFVLTCRWCIKGCFPFQDPLCSMPHHWGRRRSQSRTKLVWVRVHCNLFIFSYDIPPPIGLSAGIDTIIRFLSTFFLGYHKFWHVFVSVFSDANPVRQKVIHTLRPTSTKVLFGITTQCGSTLRTPRRWDS